MYLWWDTLTQLAQFCFQIETIVKLFDWLPDGPSKTIRRLQNGEKRKSPIWKPYLVSEENSHCTRRYTEAQIIDECGCRYGIIHDITSDELLREVRPCNYTDMVRIGPFAYAIFCISIANIFGEWALWKRCGNQYVQKFVFGTDDFVSDICKQPCQNLDFSVRFGFDVAFVVSHRK